MTGLFLLCSGAVAPLLEAGRIQAFDAFHGVECRISGDDAGDTQALHDGEMQQIATFKTRVCFDEACRILNIQPVYRLRPPRHQAGETLEDLSAACPCSDRRVTMNELL